MRGDLDAALEHYAASLVTYRAAGHARVRSGPLLNNMGIVYTQLDRLDEAHAAYDEALLHCDAIGDSAHRLLALVNSTGLWLARGDVERASALCDTVLLEATVANDQRALGETYKYMGVIARTRGALDDAERHLDRRSRTPRAEKISCSPPRRRANRRSCTSSMGKNRETLQALSRSHQFYTKLRRAVPSHRPPEAHQPSRDALLRSRRRAGPERSNPRTPTRSATASASRTTRARWRATSGYDDITMFWFRIGALLHDVGKIAVPSEILNKPGHSRPTSARSWRPHAAAGYDMLRDIDFPWDILPLVRGHHERWDGTGYPDKLAGDDIAAQRAHRLRGRRVRRADDGPALPTRVHVGRGADDDGEGHAARSSTRICSRGSSASCARSTVYSFASAHATSRRRARPSSMRWRGRGSFVARRPSAAGPASAA